MNEKQSPGHTLAALRQAWGQGSASVSTLVSGITAKQARLGCGDGKVLAVQARGPELHSRAQVTNARHDFESLQP